MKKTRLIPVLLLKNGWLVQSKGFTKFKNLGNPVDAVKRLSEWGSDELIYLDISRDDVYDLRRDDLNQPNRHSILEILEDVSKTTFMPMTVGGKIKTLGDIHDRLSRGADKISINTQAVLQPTFITEAAREFGAQCVVVSIDTKIIDTKYKVVINNGATVTDLDPIKWAKEAEKRGAGEILINSIDRDGTKIGYDIDLLRSVAAAVNIPVIACGGVGDWQDMAVALNQTKIDAVAAANIFQHIDQSVYMAKKYLYEHGCQVRPPDLMNQQTKGGI